jgi:hypothetical protein
MTFVEQDGAMTIMHTAVFATAEEVRWATRVHHADHAVSAMMGKPAMPVDRIHHLCLSYGLPTRDDGAHWAIDPDSCELMYVWPEGR